MPICRSHRCLVVAHRGASATAPENTLIAFETAAAAGADAVELDVHLTRDEGVVVLHDERLERTTQLSGPVAARNAADVRDADAGWGFTDPGGGHPFRERGVGVPTLEDALECCAALGLAVNVEIKNIPGREGYDPSCTLARRVAALVAERREDDGVFLSSFNLLDLHAAREVAPGVAAAWLTVAAMAPRVALDAVVEQGLDGLHAEAAALPGETAAVVAELAEEAGKWLMAWTVDDPEAIRALAAAGVDAVCTNDPALARRVLDGTGHAEPEP